MEAVKIQDTETLRKIFSTERTIVLIGQSACGKETQAKILLEMFQKYSPEDFQKLYLETGGLFRQNIPKYSDYMRQKLADINDAGGLQSPAFGITQGTGAVLEQWQGKGHILIDGSPRSEEEARSMFSMYTDCIGREMIVFHIKVSDEVAEERMVRRNLELLSEGKVPRKDSATPESRKRKLSFYHEHVRDAVLFLEEIGVCVHKIDGEKTVEEISEEILLKLL